MDGNGLRVYLESEFRQAFHGWDFSYLQDRMKEDPLPWSYREIVQEFILNSETLLDMDTGGGEFLDAFPVLPKTTYATERYEPNIPIAADRLKKRGITVIAVTGNDHLPIADQSIDVVINRHGGYYIPEIKRVLKPDGVFITQQVGTLNLSDLNLALGEEIRIKKDWSLVRNIRDFTEAGMRIERYGETLVKSRFFDIGAIVYFLKCIPWQIPDFSIEKYFHRLEIMHGIIREKGYQEFISHRFFLVTRNMPANILRR